MNEKYIEAIYTQKGGKDVFGDYEKFKSLITTNDKYASNIYSKLGGEGAFGDYEKFRKLTKASEQAPIEQAPVEKKKDSSKGSSTPSWTDSKSTKPQTNVFSGSPIQSIVSGEEIPEEIKTSQPSPSYVDRKINSRAEEIKKEMDMEGLSTSKKYEALKPKIDSIDTKLQSYGSEYFNEIEIDFNARKANIENIQVDMQSRFPSFYDENTGTFSKQIQGKDGIISMSPEEEARFDELNELYKVESEALKEAADKYTTSVRNIRELQSQKVAAKMILKEDGSWMGSLWTGLTADGIPEIVAGAAKIAIDQNTLYPDVVKKVINKDIDRQAEEVSNFLLENVSLPTGGSTREYAEGRFIPTAMQGLGASIPAMLTTAMTGGTTMFAMNYNSADKLVSEIPDSDLSNNEKVVFKIALAGTVSALENFGFSNLVKNTPVLKSVIAKSLISRGDDMLKAGLNNEFTNLVLNEAKNATAALNPLKAKGAFIGERFVTGSLSEGETGYLQGVAEDVFQQSINAMKGKEVFESKGIKDIAIDNIEDGLMEAFGGGVMSLTIGVLASPRSTNKQYEAATKALGAISLKDIGANLDALVLEGKMDAEKAKEIYSKVKSYKSVLDKVPEDFSDADKVEAVRLISLRNGLMAKMEGKDEAFSEPIKKNIESINAKLSQMVTASTTEESVAEEVAAEEAETEVREPAVEEKGKEADIERRRQEKLNSSDLYHTGDDLTLENVSVEPRVTRQGRKGKYGGLYTYDNLEDIKTFSQANNTKNTFGITLNKGVEIKEYTGSIERLNKEKLEELRQQGYQVVKGKSLFGRTEIIIIDKSAIKSIENHTEINAKYDAELKALKEQSTFKEPVIVETPNLDGVSSRATKGELINEAEIETAVNEAYDALDSIEKDDSISEQDKAILTELYEDEIQRLENYDKTTTTETRKVAEEKTVRTVKKTPRKTIPSREKDFVGKTAKYRDNKGGGQSGKIAIVETPDGKEYYVLETAGKKEVVGFKEEADGKVILKDGKPVRKVATMDSSRHKVILGETKNVFSDAVVNFDAKGSPVSVTFPSKSGSQVTVFDPEIAMEFEIEKAKNTEYDEQVFEETYIEFVAEEKVEVLKPKTQSSTKEKASESKVAKDGAVTLNDLKAALRAAVGDKQGIVFDPKSRAAADVALTNLIIKYVKQEGIKTAKALTDWLKKNLSLEISNQGADYLIGKAYGSKKTTTPKGQPTEKEVKAGEKAGVSPKNLRELYKLNRDMWGLDRVKAFASAIAMDRMIGAMAKRAVKYIDSKGNEKISPLSRIGSNGIVYVNEGTAGSPVIKEVKNPISVGVSKQEMYATIEFRKGDKTTFQDLSRMNNVLFQLAKKDLKQAPFLLNIANKYASGKDEFRVDIQQVDDINELEDYLDDLSENVFKKYAKTPAQISDGQIRGELRNLQTTSPRQAMQILGNAGIVFRENVDEYTSDELSLLKPKIEEALTKTRKAIGEKWQEALSKYPPSVRYVAARAIYQYINKSKSAYPIGFVEDAFNQTIKDFEATKNAESFNFYTEYNKNVINSLTDDKSSTIEVSPKNGIHGTWVKMTKASESKDVDATKTKVAAASFGTAWCTKATDTEGTGAKKVIQEDDHDFYVFFPKNSTQAQIAIVPIKEGEESQLENNRWYTGVFRQDNGSDNQVPLELHDSVNELARKTKDKDLARTLDAIGYSGMTKEEMMEIKKNAERGKIDFFENHSSEDFSSEADFIELNRLFGITLTRNGDDINLHEYNEGIESQIPDSIKDEFLKKFFNTITNIEGDAVFTGSRLKSLGKLRNIWGGVDFEGSQIKSLGELHNIGGGASFSGSQIKSLGELRNIWGNASFEISQIESLGKLRNIGGSATFSVSQIESLGELRNIGGDANFIDSQVESLGELRNIGGSAFFSDSQVKSLGELRNIRGGAYFSDSQIKSLGELRNIGGSANFKNSQIESLSELRNIGGFANFRDSKIELESTPIDVNLGALYSNVSNSFSSRLSNGEDVSFDDVFNEFSLNQDVDGIRFQVDGINDKNLILKVFHGTSKDKEFKKFKDTGKGVFVTISAKEASDYAEQNDSMKFGDYDFATRTFKEINTASRVIPMNLELGKVYKLSKEDFAYLNSKPNYAALQKQLHSKIKSEGYDTIDYGGGVYAVITQNRLTSILTNDVLFQDARGAMMIGADGKAIVYALTDPNISTPLHELAHVFEHYLSDQERTSVLKWANETSWNRDVSEKFARGYEGFLANGKAPTASMQKIFDRFKEWLTDIYNGITGSEIDVRLNKPMRDIYSSMLGKNLVTMNELKKAAIKSFGLNRDEKTFDPKDESTKSFRKELLKYVKALKITEPQAVIDLLKNEFTLEISEEDAKYIIDESTNKKRRAEEESVLKEVNAITSSNNSPISFMGVINKKTISLFSQSELESLSKFIDKFNQSGNTFGIGAVQAMVEGRVSASETDLRAKKAVTKTEGALTPSTTGFMGMFNRIEDSLRFARESGVAALEFGLTKVGDLTNKYTAHFKKAIESMKVDLTHNTQSEALLIAMIEQELIRNESNLQSTYSDAEIIDMVIKNFKQDIAYLISQNMYKDYTEMMSKHIERFEGMETLAEVLDAASKDSKNLVKILKESNAIDIDARKAMAHQNGVSFKERQDHISIRRKGISKEPREVSIDELANDQDGLSIVQIFESTPLRTHESNYTLERSKDFVSHEYGVYYDPQFVSGQIESFNSVNKAIYTRDGVIKVNSFLRNPKSKDIFRGRLKDSQGMSNENYFKEGLNRSMNQDVIEKQSRQELRDIKLAWGRLPAGKMLTSLTGFWRDKGLMLAMGTLTQPIRQAVVIASSSVNIVAMGRADVALVIPNKVRQLLDKKGGYSPSFIKIMDDWSISLRDNVESVGISSDRFLSIEKPKFIGAFQRASKKGFDFSTNLLMRNPDRVIAQATWLSYYQAYMMNNNLDVTADYSSESWWEGQASSPNKEAGDFANAMTKKDQNINAPFERSWAQSTDIKGRGSATRAVIKNIFPFMGFTFNKKGSIVIDLNRAVARDIKGKDRAMAAAMLGGAVSEVALYSYLTIMLIPYCTAILKDVIKSVFGDDDFEDEMTYMEQHRSKMQDFTTKSIQDLFWFTGNLGFIDTAFNEGVNRSWYQLFADKEMYPTYETYAGSGGTPLRSFSFKGDWFDNLGIGGIVMETMNNSYKFVSAAANGYMETPNGQYVYFSDQQRETLLFMGAMQALGVLGIPYTQMISADLKNTSGGIARAIQKEGFLENKLLAEYVSKRDAKEVAEDLAIEVEQNFMEDPEVIEYKERIIKSAKERGEPIPEITWTEVFSKNITGIVDYQRKLAVYYNLKDDNATKPSGDKPPRMKMDSFHNGVVIRGGAFNEMGYTLGRKVMLSSSFKERMEKAKYYEALNIIEGESKVLDADAVNRYMYEFIAKEEENK